MTSTAGLDVIQALLASGTVSRHALEQALTLVASPAAPTHSEFVPLAEASCTPGTLRTYRTTFRRLAREYGDRPVNQVTAPELHALALRFRAAAVAATGGTGVGAQEGFIRGARRFYRVAKDHGYLTANPADDVEYAKRNPRVRRALTADELQAVYTVALATTRDPELDLLILDFHRETACRQGGATNLRITDLNIDRGSVLLREKFGTEREIPCSRDVQQRIARLWSDRAPSRTALEALRLRRGTPLTRRHYNVLFGKVQDALPWAKRLGVSAHWLRHTTLTDISRATNGRIAAAYAGHAASSTTDIYTTVTFEELVAAHDLVFPTYGIGGG